jgi:hypothetical protein
MYELTSENNGSTYFKCTLEINEENLATNGFEVEKERRRLESDNPYSFSWKILRTETLKEISFAFKFKNPSLISKYAKDKMIIEFLKPEQFLALADNKVHL